MKTKGRSICNTLKAIRKQIADANGINYYPEECHFRGECKGTCPKCEQDVRDLEHELRLRQMAGKAIKVAGIAVGLISMTACSDGKQQQPVSSVVAREPNIVKREEPNPRNRQSEGAISLSGNNAKMNVGEGRVKDEEAYDNQPTENIRQTRSKDKIKNASSAQSERGETAIVKSAKDKRFTEDGLLFGQFLGKMPSFPGGFEAMTQYLKDNIHYPEKCLKDSVTGRVIVSFTVTEDGSLVDIEVMRSVAPELDKEAVRVIKNMPKWEPGEFQGEPTRVKYNVPISFRIN